MTAVAAVVRDVFRQARATGLTATLLAFTLVAAVTCLTADFNTADAGTGTLTILGGVQVVDGVPRDGAVHYLQFLHSGVIADTLGVLLALVWTAGFLPSFIEPVAVSVLLVKPPRRATLFLARFAGVVLFVAVQAALFVAAAGLALGVRTGVWGGVYWLSVPWLLAQFAVFYSFSALLAVTTRNAAGCLVGTLLFWLLCWAMNYGRHALAGLQLTEATPELLRTADLVYWVLPKPADFSLILDADRFTTPWVEFRRVQDAGLFQPVWSVASSVAAAALFLAVAVYEFAHDDY